MQLWFSRWPIRGWFVSWSFAVSTNRACDVLWSSYVAWGGHHGSSCRLQGQRHPILRRLRIADREPKLPWFEHSEAGNKGSTAVYKLSSWFSRQFEGSACGRRLDVKIWDHVLCVFSWQERISSRRFFLLLQRSSRCCFKTVLSTEQGIQWLHLVAATLSSGRVSVWFGCGKDWEFIHRIYHWEISTLQSVGQDCEKWKASPAIHGMVYWEGSGSLGASPHLVLWGSAWSWCSFGEHQEVCDSGVATCAFTTLWSGCGCGYGLSHSLPCPAVFESCENSVYWYCKEILMPQIN